MLLRPLVSDAFLFVPIPFFRSRDDDSGLLYHLLAFYVEVCSLPCAVFMYVRPVR